MKRNGKQMKLEATRLTETQPIEAFVESKSVTNFKGFEALNSNVLNIDNQLLCCIVQT
jgi:hypothetical protein